MSDHTIYAERNWQVGDSFDMPCLLGIATFKLQSRSDTELHWLSGKLSKSWIKEGKDWKDNHVTLNVDAIAKIEFV